MTSKTKNGLIVSGVVLAIVAAVYYIMKAQKTNATNTSIVEKVFQHMLLTTPELANYKPQYISSLSSQPIGYMNAWSAAIDKNSPTFVYNGTTFKTSNGVGQ